MSALIKIPVVEYIPEDKYQVEIDKGTSKGSPRVNRLVTIRDICVSDYTVPREGQDKISEVEGDDHSVVHNCLIHSPLKYWDNNLDNIRADPNVQDTIRRNKANPSSGSIFGDISFQEESLNENSQTSLVLTYFLRGDLGKQGRYGRRREATADDEGPIGIPLDVRRVWQLIFSKLASDLQLERRKHDSMDASYGAERTFSVGSEGMEPILSAQLDIDQEKDVDVEEISRDLGRLTVEGSHSLFTVGD
ncbi:hypothetical protein BGZ76_009138 [Entomortierella beljakovae]|nr:hypothetical protein BGZ76_009138 [Entomortierella beljakovae]